MVLSSSTAYLVSQFHGVTYFVIITVSFFDALMLLRAIRMVLTSLPDEQTSSMAGVIHFAKRTGIGNGLTLSLLVVIVR